MQRAQQHRIKPDESGHADRHLQLHAVLVDRHAEAVDAHEPQRRQGKNHRLHQVERIEQRQTRPRAAVLRQVRIERPHPHHQHERRRRNRAQAHDAVATREPQPGKRKRAPADQENLLEIERSQHRFYIVRCMEMMMQRAQQQCVEPQEQRSEHRVIESPRMPMHTQCAKAPQPHGAGDEREDLRHIQRIEDRQPEERRGAAVARHTRDAPQPQQGGERCCGPHLISLHKACDRPAQTMPDAGHQQQQNAEAISPRAPTPCAFRHVGAQAPIAFERKERAGRPEHQRMQRREHVIADVALLTPQQHVGRRRDERANQPAVTADQRHAQHEQTQREQSEDRHKRQCRHFGERPAQLAMRGVREPGGENREQCDGGSLETIAIVCKMGLSVRMDFVEATHGPPQQPPYAGDKADLRHPCVPRPRFAAAMQAPSGEDTRNRDQHGRDVRTVQDRPRMRAVDRCERADDIRARCGQLHQQAEAKGGQAPLTHGEPGDRGAFDCPGRACGRSGESERHGERGEDHGQREHGLEHHVETHAPPRQPARDREVERGQRHRAPRETEFGAPHQRRLQTDRDKRRAEYQRAVDVMLKRDLAAHRVEQRDADIHQEEQNQERLSAGKQLRPVSRHAPHGADREREHEAKQIQRPPSLEPRNCENARVEQRVVAEQHHVTAAARRQENRREEAARAAHEGQRRRVLPHRQKRAQAADRDHQRQGRARRQQMVELRCGEHRQIERTDAAALQDQPVRAAALANAPAESKQGGRGKCDAGEAEFDRQQAVVGRVFEQERNAEEQHNDADAHDRVAAE